MIIILVNEVSEHTDNIFVKRFQSYSVGISQRARKSVTTRSFVWNISESDLISYHVEGGPRARALTADRRAK